MNINGIFRGISRRPAYAMGVCGVMAVALGSATAMYSLVSWALFPQKSFDVSRVIAVETKVAGLPQPVSVPMIRFRGYRDSAKSISLVSGCWTEWANVYVESNPEGMRVAHVSENALQLFGGRMEIGRGFLPEDFLAGAQPVAILSVATWKNRFRSSAQILGQTVRIGEVFYRVVGVLAERFTPPVGISAAIYTPLDVPAGALTAQQATQSLVTFAWLEKGRTPEEAQAELRTIRPETGTALEAMFQQAEPMVSKYGRRPLSAQDQRQQTMARLAIGTIALLYFIGTVTATNLMVMSAYSRVGESGIRLALGASPAAASIPFVGECLMLIGTAVFLGAVFARWIFPVIMAVAPGADEKMLASLSLDWTGYAALSAIGMVTGVVASLWPMAISRRANLTAVLAEGSNRAGNSPRARKVRGCMVMLSVTLTTLLLIGTVGAIRIYQQLQNADNGFLVQNRYVATFMLPATGTLSSDARRAVYSAMIDGVLASGTVKEAAMADTVLPSYYLPRPFRIPDESARKAEAHGHTVSISFFRAMGMRVIAGNPAAAFSGSGLPMVVVNQALADLYLGGGAAVGKEVELFPGKRYRVAGVVSNIRPPHDDYRPRYYLSLDQGGGVFQMLFETSSSLTSEEIKEIRQDLYQSTPSMVLVSFRSLGDALADELWFERFSAILLQILGLFSLVLCVAGIFTTLKYSIFQQHRELAICYALGATPAQIYGRVMRHGVLLSGIGSILGCLLAWWIGRMRAEFFPAYAHVSAMAPLLIALMFVSVGALAALLSVRSVVAKEPMATLV